MNPQFNAFFRSGREFAEIQVDGIAEFQARECLDFRGGWYLRSIMTRAEIGHFVSLLSIQKWIEKGQPVRG